MKTICSFAEFGLAAVHSLCQSFRRPKWNRRVRNGLRIAALALATVRLTQAGTFQTDFSTDPGGTGIVNRPEIMELITNSQLTLIDLADVLDEFGNFQPTRLPLQ